MLASVLTPSAHAQPEAERPNLVLVMTDQQRFDTLAVNGNSNMKTPVLDKLARSGANMHGYFATSPVCGPSRASFFTGRYPHSHRIRENYSLPEAGREIHLFRILKQNGYRLGHVGKNHIVDPQEMPNFDLFSQAGSHEQSPEEKKLIERYYQHREEIDVPLGNSELWRTGFVHEGPVESTRTWQSAQAAIDFIEQQDGEKPFALTVCFEDPHLPHIVLKEYFEKYPLDEIDLLPVGGEKELEKKALRWAVKHAALNAETASEEEKKRYIAIYRAMISWIDTQTGRILQTLEDQGLRENTLVVFTSDHGDFSWQHNQAFKDLVLADSLLHVPCIYSWPGQIEAQTYPEEVLVSGVDMLPTILDLLGVETPIGVQGTSFAPLLRGESGKHKDAVFAEVCPPYLYNKYESPKAFVDAHGGPGNTPFNVPGDFTKSIRTADWRYIWYGTGEEELYDHREDPHELNNLAGDPEYADVKQRLKMRLLEWNALTEDPLDPNLRRDLQAKYDNWTPLSIEPGKHEQPSWKETIHMDLSKPVWNWQTWEPAEQ
ncbi:MAG: sulfatase [Phycisphaeraceae bacterium]